DGFRDAVRVDVRVELRRDHLARRQQRVRLLDRRGDVLGGDVARLRLDRIDDDVDLTNLAAVDRRATHAVDAFDLRLDVVLRVVVELAARDTGPGHDDLA